MTRGEKTAISPGTHTVQLSAYQLQKRTKVRVISVFSDASLSFEIKPFIQSIKNLTDFNVTSVSEHKYGAHIFESAYFPPNTACMWVYLHVSSAVKASTCWLFSKLWLCTKKKVPQPWSFIFIICNYRELKADPQLIALCIACVCNCVRLCVLVMHHASDRWV